MFDFDNSDSPVARLLHQLTDERGRCPFFPHEGMAILHFLKTMVGEEGWTRDGLETARPQIGRLKDAPCEVRFLRERAETAAARLDKISRQFLGGFRDCFLVLLAEGLNSLELDERGFLALWRRSEYLWTATVILLSVREIPICFVANGKARGLRREGLIQPGYLCLISSTSS